MNKRAIGLTVLALAFGWDAHISANRVGRDFSRTNTYNVSGEERLASKHDVRVAIRNNRIDARSVEHRQLNAAIASVRNREMDRKDVRAFRAEVRFADGYDLRSTREALRDGRDRSAIAEHDDRRDNAERLFQNET